jgi:hypothetical protein
MPHKGASLSLVFDSMYGWLLDLARFGASLAATRLAASEMLWEHN